MDIILFKLDFSNMMVVRGNEIQCIRIKQDTRIWINTQRNNKYKEPSNLD